MLLTHAGGVESFAQFMTVLLLFLVVLAITYLTTRYAAGLQKLKQEGSNISVVETCRIAPNKYIQIIRLGSRYIAVAVCKDTITKIAELAEDEMIFPDAPESGMPDFAAVLEKVRLKKHKK